MGLDGGSPVPLDRTLPENQTGDPDSFRYEPSLTGTGARMAHVRIEASKDGTTQTQQGWLYAPPASETLQYDADGNLTSDARWTYEWDAENRLVAMEERDTVTRPAGAPPRKRLSFAYDFRHRRVAKEVREWSAATGSFSALVKSRRFVYDDWNMIVELDAADCAATSLEKARVLTTYVWGPDLAGQQGSVFEPESFSGAGGVGGLLAIRHQTNTYYPCMDANGNIMGLVNATAGTLTSRYDYDPFGARVTDTGPTGSNGQRIELCPFGFSTKYTDSETGLAYYGYRVYDPPNGRWPSRDPIGERGGINLYGMVGNDPVNKTDYLGLLFGFGTPDKCKINLWVRHFGIGTDIGDGLKDKFDDHEDGDPKCGFVGCGSNHFNQQANSQGWGVPDMPQNKKNYPGGHPLGPYGPKPNDYDDETEIPGMIDEAIEAAKAEAQRMCQDQSLCCKKVKIYVKCSSDLKKQEQRNRDEGKNMCGKTITVDCRK